MSETTGPSGQDPYAFVTDRAEEERRLVAQARLFEPMTDDLLREAGLGPGMRVVDLGSGAGDMAILAARLVGPGGSVLGIERSAEQAAMARKRVADLGLANVVFQEADVADLGAVLAAQPQPVDAVIGRLILMWVPDRIGALRACAATLAPGALVWFLEPDMLYDYAVPATPLWNRVRGWIIATLERLAADVRMGPRLHGAFHDAGLPPPELRCRTVLAGPQSAPVWFWVNIVRVMLPMFIEFGVVGADEVDLPTLEGRLAAELAEHDAVMLLPPMTAAWARIPG